MKRSQNRIRMTKDMFSEAPHQNSLGLYAFVWSNVRLWGQVFDCARVCACVFLGGWWIRGSGSGFVLVCVK